MFFSAIHSLSSIIPPECPPRQEGAPCPAISGPPGWLVRFIPGFFFFTRAGRGWISISGGKGVILSLCPSRSPKSPTWVLGYLVLLYQMCTWRELHRGFCCVSRCRGCFCLYIAVFGGLGTIALRKLQWDFSVNICSCPWACGFVMTFFEDLKILWSGSGSELSPLKF